MPEGDGDVDQALRKGELKFTLAGKSQGGWVLVHLRRREGEKRNNWLSGASGLTMEQIAAGGPKPFMAQVPKHETEKPSGVHTARRRASRAGAVRRCRPPSHSGWG